MMMKFKLKRDIFSLVVLAAASIFILWIYSGLPDQIPINWGMSGEVDGYMSKPLGAFWGILAGIGIYLFFYLQLVIDPLRENYERFEDKYWLIRDLMVVLFVGTNLYGIFWALDYIREPSIIIALISILFIVLGNYMPTFKRNWFLGIKTPWTLSSEESWNKTHRLGGKLFIATGLIGLAEALFLSGNRLFGGAAIVTAVVSFGYSYLIYRREVSLGRKH